MILTCGSKRINCYDGKWHKFFAVLRHLDDGRCIVLESVERRYECIDDGCWAGGHIFAWHYRGKVTYPSRDSYAGTYLGKETVHG